MSLDSVRRALAADADAEAARLLAAARTEVDARLAAGRQEAARITDAARADGEAEARRASAVEEARARRRGRERVLVARRDAIDGLRVVARQAAVELRDDPRYPQLLAGLRTAARGQLGDAATVQIDDQTGGLVATAGSRSVDYRLDAIVDRCVDDLGVGVEALWR